MKNYLSTYPKLKKYFFHILLKHCVFHHNKNMQQKKKSILYMRTDQQIISKFNVPLRSMIMYLFFDSKKPSCLFIVRSPNFT